MLDYISASQPGAYSLAKFDLLSTTDMEKERGRKMERKVSQKHRSNVSVLQFTCISNFGF